MAASAVIGALRINLGLNSGSFRSGLDQSEQRLSRFGAGAKAAFAVVAAAAIGAATALGFAVKGSIDAADEMSKMAQRVGVPVEALSRLAYAGKYADVELGTLGTSITKLSKNLADISMGKGADAAAAFDAIGVSAHNADGTLKSANDVIYDVADAFAAMPDGVTKTAAAVKIFGRAGADLIPLLNGGSEGLKRMAIEADNLGFTLSEETGRKAELFNDTLTTISAVLGGLSNQVMVAVLPGLIEIADRFAMAATEGGNFDGVIDGIGGAMNIMAKMVGFAFDHLQDLYDLFRIFVATRIILFVGSVAGSMLTLARTIRTVGLSMKLVTSITHAKITAIILLAAAVAKLTGVYDQAIGWIKQFGDEVMAALPEGVRNGLADFTDGLAELGLGIEAADDAGAAALDTYINAGNTAADSFGNVTESIKGSTDELTVAEDKAKSFADRVGEAFKSLGSDIKGLIAGTTSWNDVLINVLESLARVGMQQWLLNTATPESGSGIGGMLTSFIGGLFGFANGGSFKVGGQGGIDSQPVAFMASPDEVVSVMTPAQQKDAAAYEGGGKTINVKNTLNIQTPDARSFKASEAQISGRLAMMTQRGARTL